MNKKKTVDEIVEENEIIEEDNVVEEKSENEVLQDKIDELTLEVTNWKNQYYSAYADMENLRKRLMQEHENILKYISQDLITSLLPLLDNFERAMVVTDPSEEVKNYIKGCEMIYDQFLTILKNNSVEVIEALGKPFDPNYHQAVMQVQDDSVESNIVVEELQKGYKLKDRVIRPSLVKVSE